MLLFGIVLFVIGASLIILGFANIHFDKIGIIKSLSKYTYFSDADAYIAQVDRTEYIIKKQLPLTMVAMFFLAPVNLMIWNFLLHRFIGIGLSIFIYPPLMLGVGFAVWYCAGYALKHKANNIRTKYRDELVILIESFILVKGDILSIENALDELFKLIKTPLLILIKNKVMQFRNTQKPVYKALSEVANEINLDELDQLSRIFATVELRGVQSVEQLREYKKDLSNQSLMELMERIHKVSSKIDTPNALLAMAVLLFFLFPTLFEFISI